MSQIFLIVSRCPSMNSERILMGEFLNLVYLVSNTYGKKIIHNLTIYLIIMRILIFSAYFKGNLGKIVCAFGYFMLFPFKSIFLV